MTVTDEPTTDQRNVGAVRLRKEDARLVTGQTRWTDNLTAPGMLYAVFVRSTMAHARIASIDVDAARSVPNVIAVYTAADLADDWANPLPSAWPVTPDMVNPPHWPLAKEEVCYVGDAVAVVVGRTRAAAADGAEAVIVDLEPLEAVVEMEAALTDEVIANSAAGTNQAYVWNLDNGEVDAAFEGADVVVKRRFIQQRLIPAAMEPRAVLVDPTPASGEYTMWTSTQIPHILRTMLAIVTGVSEEKLRIIAPDVGGGFGSKLDVYAEEVALISVAKHLGRAVKWTETRSEAFQATIHGRDQIQDISVAADRDGRIRAVKADIKADMGAYQQLITAGVPLLGAFMYCGIYKMDAYSFTCTGVYTNKTPTDAYRGAGRPEATFAIERIVDELAVDLGVDPMELRKRNWIGHDEFPFASPAGLTYDSGNYEAATERAMELFDYDGLRAEQAQRREAGDRVQLGLGISTYTEMCGLAPSRVLGSLDYAAGGWESATVRMLPTAKFEVVTGTSPHGQGHETTFSQIVADQLGVPFEDIEILHGDTKVSPQGLDTYGSRSLVVGGIAIHRATEKLIDQMKEVVAHQLEAAVDDIELADGRFFVKGTPATAKTVAEVAFAVFAAHDLPDGFSPSLQAEHTYDPENFSFPHGTHLCAVEVDTDTGSVDVRSYVAVDDIGNVINPQVVEGQVHGGLAQGIAQALWEEAIYDEIGQLRTGSIVDYYVPGAPDVPTFVTDRTVTPAPGNPLGVKGVGEAGCIASTPAVVNAVLDAVRHLGVIDIRMPCSPERVWRAIHGQADTTQDDLSEQDRAGGGMG